MLTDSRLPGILLTGLILTGLFEMLAWLIRRLIVFPKARSNPLPAETALRKSEAKQRAIIEALPDLLMRADREGFYLDFWPTDKFQLLRSGSDVIGRNMLQTLPPDLARQRLSAVKAAIDTGEMQVYEQTIELPDKLQIEEVRVVAAEENEAILLVRDISDRKQAEAQLREREASLQEFNLRWSALLNEVQLLVIELDLQGHIVYANPFFFKLTGYQLHEVYGQPWIDTFLPAETHAEMRSHFCQFMQGRAIENFQPDVILTKTREELIITWNKTLLHDGQGNSIGMISIGEDITNQYELELIKSEFIAVVSHELRTPLASIQAGLSLLDSYATSLDTQDARHVIEIASRGVDRLASLVDNILDLRRLESGKLTLQKTWFDAAEIAKAAIEQVQEIANQAGITLVCHAHSVRVYGDSEMIRQVLVNLLSNGIKFSPEKTTVLIELIPETDGLRFAVIDQGRGIPASQLGQVFDRFYQVDTSDARPKSGSGLGLAICRNIIRQHMGHIWVESTLGKGSTFYFTLPWQ